MKRVGKGWVWDKEDIDILRQNADTLSFFDIGKMLGVSSSTVGKKALELGISHGRTFNRYFDWKDEQIDYLRENYATSTVSDMADHLGVSPGCINRMAEKLGLRKSDSVKRVYTGRYVRNYKNNERNYRKLRGKEVGVDTASGKDINALISIDTKKNTIESRVIRTDNPEPNSWLKGFLKEGKK